MNKKRKTFLIISWVLFGLTSSFIIVESCIPSDKSGNQSRFLSKISANIVNFFSPSKKVKSVDPSSLSVKCTDPSAMVGDTKTSIVNQDKAIIGTTKLYTYNLTFQDDKADIYNSNVNLSCISSPGENSYSSSITTGKSNGTIRIIPLIEGHYSFELKDSSNHSEVFSFDAINRTKSNEISSNITSISLDIGEYKCFPYAFTFGDLVRNDTSTDHYLQRFYSRSLTEFTSSDESIFSVSDGGLIKGIGDGTASLLFKGEEVCNITVNNNVYVSQVDHISLSTSKTDIAPLDFDYLYGSQLDVHYFNALDEEIVSNEPIKFVSDNPLIAMVDNDHQEIVSGELTNVKGGFVSGYRNFGKTSVRAYLCSNTTKTASIEFESKVVNPSSATISAKSGNLILSTSQSNQLIAGETIYLSKSYIPLNASNTELKVEVSDSNILEVQNNNTINPSINILKAGNCSFSTYMPSIGEESKVTYSLVISSPKAIEDKDMNNFHQIVRKGAGHFALFFVDALFGFIAFSLTIDLYKKKWWISLLINISILLFTGFAVAGISELIQLIPSLHRGGSMLDVLIDFVGFTIATILGAAIFIIIKLIKLKKDKTNNSSLVSK